MLGTFWNEIDTSIFNDFRRLEDEVSRLLGYPAGQTGIRASQRGAFPLINVGSTPDNVTVYLFAAGLNPKELDISVQQNALSISGRRRSDAPAEGEVYRQERFDGEFRRVVALPDNVDPDRVRANYRDGVLEITVERRESARPRQITVN